MSILYRTKYTNSWAIVIGINQYKEVGNLGFACNDAEAIGLLLKEIYGFPEENITVLLDEDATKVNIMSTFLKLANEEVQIDDRIVFFYAGHGHTISGKRGDIGFLVPHDGTLNDLSSLIRWDDLTRGAELIRAKHILFIMDACYSGLAITRSLQPGSVRFLKDMLRRNSRQVLTAGKANEVVADANGPIAGHSIFTGHLIQALQGSASTSDGIITANGVMSYVYEKVSNDSYSQQTPHYGFVDGDGDFIFSAPILEKSEDSQEIEKDYFIEVPAVLQVRNSESTEEIIEQVKEHLSDRASKIKLDDLVNIELRKVISLLNDEHFPTNEPFTKESFAERLNKYEETIARVLSITSCIAHWGHSEHVPTMNKIVTRLSESIESKDGLQTWIKLRWYPITYLIYSSGISAIANENYEHLARLLTMKVHEQYSDRDTSVILLAISDLTDLHEMFKNIPGHERQYVPRSELLYKISQPVLDDLFFLGKSYESLFDRFEIFLALVYADQYSSKYNGDFWGPIGRFGWKYRRSNNIYDEILKEAEVFKEKWPPIEAGLFNGSYERFKEVASGFEKVLKQTNFF